MAMGGQAPGFASTISVTSTMSAPRTIPIRSSPKRASFMCPSLSPHARPAQHEGIWFSLRHGSGSTAGRVEKMRPFPHHLVLQLRARFGDAREFVLPAPGTAGIDDGAI